MFSIISNNLTVKLKKYTKKLLNYTRCYVNDYDKVYVNGYCITLFKCSKLTKVLIVTIKWQI